ncbi:MAG: hypothetical protein US96_C0010G0016 [Candidatus Woesebacteria bacterium GW2011_GWB1_38_5b]|uniref:Uncharacterized protein n=1 Tax=Candidatus Woesebacteria bacterium GW2011_GWB1_38_5b TaxID=1618569 RepID=A0A0G0KIZ0_9BACT|nr:MAG: hypothetical protein US96_C0010G0016 [Candidatus Woesebacteria bacterium GW2011_GWB1_38_5b]
MITSKAKLSTPWGPFEFEGESDFVKEQIDKVINKLSSLNGSHLSLSSESLLRQESSPTKSTNLPSKSLPRKSFYEQPKILQDFISKDKLSSFEQFVKSKIPQNHQETFAVIAYWLKYNLQKDEVGIDEMWTSYKMLGKRPPQVLVQVLRDARSKKIWFDSGSQTGYYKLTSRGESFVEHDLPANQEDQIIQKNASGEVSK